MAAGQLGLLCVCENYKRVEGVEGLQTIINASVPRDLTSVLPLPCFLPSFVFLIAKLVKPCCRSYCRRQNPTTSDGLSSFSIRPGDFLSLQLTCFSVKHRAALFSAVIRSASPGEHAGSRQRRRGLFVRFITFILLLYQSGRGEMRAGSFPGVDVTSSDIKEGLGDSG